jgi:GNAT acetyltransferase-like protein
LPEITTTALTDQWTETRTRFRYSLSDLRLFEITLKGRTCVWPQAPSPSTVFSDSDLLFASLPPSGDVFYLRNCPLDHPLPRLMIRDGWIRYVLNQSDRYYIDLTGTFLNYLAVLSTKTRSTLKRKVKKFADFSGETFALRLYSTPDDMLEYHRLARQIAVKTYQERLFDGALPASERFQQELVTLAASSRVWGLILFAHHQPVSYLCLPISDNVLEYAFLGYDPAYSHVSPGTVLLYHSIERIFAENRFRQFDFGYGKNQTKEVFCTGKHLRADVYYLRTSLKHLAVIYSHALMESCSAACGRLLDRFDMRRTIKKILRST